METNSTSAPRLADLQQWLRKVFTAVPGPQSPDFTESIVDQPPISRADRLAIYSNGYFWRLLECLSEDFEATGKSITHLRDYDTFSSLVREFLRAHPSQSANITDFGSSFSHFVGEQPLALDFPWLPELARLERAYLESFLALGPLPVPPERLRLLSGESGAMARFEMAPSVRLLLLDWPVLGVWRKRKGACALSFPKAKRTQCLFLRRVPAGTVSVDVVGPTAFRLLSALAGGQTLGAACAGVENEIKDPAVLSRWFESWMSEGIFANLSL